MKTIKFYEAPACKVVDLKLESMILVGSGEGGNGGAENTEIEGGESGDDL